METLKVTVTYEFDPQFLAEEFVRNALEYGDGIESLEDLILEKQVEFKGNNF